VRDHTRKQSESPPPTREQLLRSYARRFSGISSQQIAKQFDEYMRLGALDVKWDTIRREWRVTLKLPPKQDILLRHPQGSGRVRREGWQAWLLLPLGAQVASPGFPHSSQNIPYPLKAAL
jgi:hypothetical protein